MVAGTAFAGWASVGHAITFDCVRGSAKVGDVGRVCALFEQRLSAAFPGRVVHRSDDADVVLVVEMSGEQSFVARVDWRGRARGDALGVAVKGAALGEEKKAELIDSLLRTMPQ